MLVGRAMQQCHIVYASIDKSLLVYRMGGPQVFRLPTDSLDVFGLSLVHVVKANTSRSLSQWRVQRWHAVLKRGWADLEK